MVLFVNRIENKVLWIRSLRSYCFMSINKSLQWKRISCKYNTRWPHLSRLKASAFFALQKKFVKKGNNLCLELVTPSSRWWRPVVSVWHFQLLHYKGNFRKRGLLLGSVLAYLIKLGYLCLLVSHTQVIFSLNLHPTHFITFDPG